MNALRRLRGQTGTEVMMVISVIVIAVAAGSYAFVPKFRTGVNRLGTDVRRMLSTGQRGRARPASPSAPTGPLYAPSPFRLPGSPDAGCAAGVVCLPEARTPLGTPVNVCRPGDRC